MELIGEGRKIEGSTTDQVVLCVELAELGTVFDDVFNDTLRLLTSDR